MTVFAARILYETLMPQVEPNNLSVGKQLYCVKNPSVIVYQITTGYSPSLCLIQQFASNADEHAVGKGRLETRLGELVEHLGDGKTVILPEVIQQA